MADITYTESEIGFARAMARELIVHGIQEDWQRAIDDAFQFLDLFELRADCFRDQDKC